MTQVLEMDIQSAKTIQSNSISDIEEQEQDQYQYQSSSTVFNPSENQVQTCHSLGMTIVDDQSWYDDSIDNYIIEDSGDDSLQSSVQSSKFEELETQSHD
jgi:hypothetical protein